MIHKCIALIVPARLSEAVTVATIDTRSGSLAAVFGNGLECVARGDWHVYLDADHHAAELRPNLRAAQLLHDAGLDLPEVTGIAVFLGRAEHDFDTDVPEHLIHRAGALFDTHLGATQPAA